MRPTFYLYLPPIYILRKDRIPCEGNHETGFLAMNAYWKGSHMNTVLLVILILLIVGALPTWPYSASWGYYPSGGLGLILLIVVILALLGRL